MIIEIGFAIGFDKGELWVLYLSHRKKRASLSIVYGVNRNSTNSNALLSKSKIISKTGIVR